LTPKPQFHTSTGRYQGRRAVITGGANGLGYATALRLGTEGAALALIDLDGAAAETAAQKLRDAGCDADGYAADVTDDTAVNEVVGEIGSHGSIDVLVTCAGVYPWIEFAEMTMEKWREIIDINLGGTFTATHAVMPKMKEQGYGRIVTISSETYLLGMTGQSAYIASKAGVIGLTRVLARDGGPSGVTANCVLPGLIATDRVLTMNDEVDAFFEAITADQCIKRRGEPEDIADAVAYLGSEGSEFVTGQSLAVGGGDRYL
jgi:NAD(P)-dependent dehydrogenase (short-subunit alcohol dehydrogenase family)